MINCFFATDLHGTEEKYKKLFNEIKTGKPEVVFLGGDLLPSGANFIGNNFIEEFFLPQLSKLKKALNNDFPKIFLILGNDDPRIEEENCKAESTKELFDYIHFQNRNFKGYKIVGYSYIPPSPFQLKDWEKYDISRFVDPGCIPPEEGIRTIAVPQREIPLQSIKIDMEELTKNLELKKSVFLFHSPPYKTNLDRADLDNKMVDHVPMDVNVGSIAIKKIIKKKQPYLTLHGHVHESTRLTGKWKDKIGKTICFNAAHDGEELSIIKFDLESPEKGERFLL